VDVDSADEHEVANGVYAFTFGIAVAAIYGDELIPVSVRGI
jgi:hypothetical protein